MLKNCIQTNNLISSKNTILIFNILRNLGLTPTLKGTKLLNKAIQIVINSDNELIPIRFSYDLSCFSEPYIEKTKTLFTYYFNKDNTFNNELLRLKKHFVHFQRFPFIVYIPLEDKYCNLIKMMKELDIECVHDKNLFISKINNNKN